MTWISGACDFACDLIGTVCMAMTVGLFCGASACSEAKPLKNTGWPRGSYNKSYFADMI